MQSSCASEYIDSPRSEPSSSPSPANFVYPTTSRQYFQSADCESWGDPWFSSECLIGREWAASGSFRGPLQDSSQVRGGHHLQQWPQPQDYQENCQCIPGQISSPRNLGEQTPLFAPQQKATGKALCYQCQEAPVLTVDKSPPVPSGQEMQ